MYSGMKLGCNLDLTRVNSERLTATQPIESWSRIIGTPIVQGFNNKYGDCAETAAFNAVQTAMSRNGIFTPLSNQSVLNLYSVLTGFNQKTGANDNGTDPMDIFKYWKNVSIAGYKLKNLWQLDPTAEGDIRHTIAILGGVYLCVDLSVDQQNQTTWLPTGTPGSWGGHAVWCDSLEGELYFVSSWGNLIPVHRSYLNTPGFVRGAFGLELCA